MEYSFSWGILFDHALPLIQGVKSTFLLGGGIIGLAMGEGLILCLLRLSGVRILSYPALWWIEIFRNVPRIVLLLWAYYCSAIYFKIEFVTPWLAALIALSLQEGAFTAEIFRAGIEVIHKGEIEAGRSIGLSYLQIMHRIVLPQAIRTTIPALTNELVWCIKTSTIASIIGVSDLLYSTNNLSQVTMHPIEFYAAAAFIFFLICWSISRLADYLRKKLSVY